MKLGEKYPLRYEGINEQEKAAYYKAHKDDPGVWSDEPDPIDKVVEERGAKYGPPGLNHQTTADFFYIYLMRVGDRRINKRDVVMLNILQKISRDLYSPCADNLTDIQGYARNAERIAEKEEQ